MNLSKKNAIFGQESYSIPPHSVVTLVCSLNEENLTFTSINEPTSWTELPVYPNPVKEAHKLIKAE